MQSLWNWTARRVCRRDDLFSLRKWKVSRQAGGLAVLDVPKGVCLSQRLLAVHGVRARPISEQSEGRAVRLLCVRSQL